MNDIYSPNQRNLDVEATRHSTLGQMHYGGMEVQTDHGFLSVFVKLSTILNGGSWVLLWGLFRMKNLFPPHDAPFMSAIGWYFFFGSLCGLVGFFIFSYARFIESQAIVRALTHNRRYEWHSNYEDMSEEELQQMPEAQEQDQAQAEVVGAGGSYFRMTGFLIMGAMAIWLMGASAFVSDLL